MEMRLVEVAPGDLDSFIAASCELTALDAKGGAGWRSVSRTEGFGDSYQFLFLSPLERFAALDRSAPLDTNRMGIENRVRRATTRETAYAIRTTPDLDNPLPDDQEPALMLVQLVTIVPGREQDYIRIMAEDVLPHFKEAGMHHTSGALTLGGPTGYVHFFHLANFAALDQGSPLARALGPEDAMKVTGKLAGVMDRSEQWLVRYDPDLSYRVEPEEEEPGR